MANASCCLPICNDPILYMIWEKFYLSFPCNFWLFMLFFAHRKSTLLFHFQGVRRFIQVFDKGIMRAAFCLENMFSLGRLFSGTRKYGRLQETETVFLCQRHCRHRKETVYGTKQNGKSNYRCNFRRRIYYEALHRLVFQRTDAESEYKERLHRWIVGAFTWDRKSVV